jgi:rhodanese-related sulfurtransferase
MSDLHPRRPDSGYALALDIATIVLVGATLGVAFNGVQRASGSNRALPWVAHERKLAKLEDVLSAPPAPPPASPGAPEPNQATGRTAASAHAIPVPADPDLATGKSPAPMGAVHSATQPATRAAPSDTNPAVHAGRPTRAEPATRSAPPPAPRAEPVAGATPPPATTSTSAPVPEIPDTREPLEAGYATVKALHVANAALFVDARSSEEYAAGHIPGAVNLPFDDVFGKPELAKSIDPKGRPIVTYCGGGDCELSKSLAFALIEAGQRKVLVFVAGLPGWKDAGNPVATGATP